MAALRIDFRVLTGASAPAVVLDLEVEAGGGVEVGLEDGEFLLLAELGQNPVQKELPGEQLDNNVRMLEDVGNEAELDVKAGSGGPLNSENLGVAGKSSANPEDDFGGPTAVISDKSDIPARYQNEPGQSFQSERPKGPHTALRCVRLRP